MERSLAKIDTQLGGPRLESQDAAAFERAWMTFQDQFDPHSREASARVEEITELLTVTDGNLEEVKNQKWFQRAWGTVSGKNRKLTKVNQQNLLRVQKGAFYFLEGLAQQNQLLMHSVYLALKRVEDNQIQNERFKAHLLKVVQRYNDRIREVEARQDDLEWKLAEQAESLERSSWGMLIISVGVLLMLTALISYVLTSNLPMAAGLAVVGLITLAFGVVRKQATRNALPTSGSLVLSAELHDEFDDVATSNARYRGELVDSIREALLYRYTDLANSCVWEAIEPLATAQADLFDDPDPPNEKVVDDWYAFLTVSNDVRDEISHASQIVAEIAVEDFNEMIGVCVDTHFHGDIGLKLQCEVEKSSQSQLAAALTQSFDYSRTIERLEAQRISLLERFPRWGDYVKEHPAYTFTKDFFKGLLIVPMFFDDTQEFMTSFWADLQTYDNSWIGFVETIIESADGKLDAPIRGATNEFVRRLGPLWDAADEQSIPLSELEHTMAEFLES